MHEPIVDYLQRHLKAAGPRRFAAIAAATGVSESLLPKLAYGMRDNPRVQTIQPLLDYFAAVDRGEIALPAEAAQLLPPGHVSLGMTDGGQTVIAEAQ